MKIITLSATFNRNLYLFYRERAVDKPREYYEVSFHNSCGEWYVTVIEPNGSRVDGFTETYKTLALGIMAADEKLSKLTGETK